MKAFRKILLTAGVIGLAVAAAFPHVDYYLKSRPESLSKVAAAKRYLSLICPSIKISNYLDSLVVQRKKELDLRYYDNDSLAAANNRVGALEARLSIAQGSYVRQLEKEAKNLLDPKFLWPEKVQKDIEAIALNDFTVVGRFNAKEDYDRVGKEKAAVYAKEEIEAGKAASRVRLSLGLPPRGKGC